MPGIRTTTTLVVNQNERLDYVLTGSESAGVTLAPPLITYTTPPFPPPTASGPYPSLTNNGAINVVVQGPSRAFAVLLDQSVMAGTSGTQVVNNGVISLTNSTASGQGITFGTLKLSIINNGDILISTFYDGSAIVGYSPMVENHGRIVVQASNAFGVSGRMDTSVINTGEIHVIGASGAGAITMGPTSSGYVNNSGLIVSEVLDTRYGGYGITTEPLLGGATIINSGVIRAAHAINVIESGYNPDSAYKPTEVTNTGSIYGNVELAQGADTVINSGLIDGDVFLGANDDLFDHRGGTVTGVLDGGRGDDVLLLHGAADAFKVLGAEGDYLVIGPNTYLRISNFEMIRFDDGSRLELNRITEPTVFEPDEAKSSAWPMTSPLEANALFWTGSYPGLHPETLGAVTGMAPHDSDWLF